MRRTSLPDTGVASRRGMTLVEVILVVIGLLLLISLVIPATRQARGPARRIQCMHNLKSLALAATNYASGHHGKLPLLSDSAPGLVSPSNKTTWVLTLMPYLDRADTHEYINQQVTRDAAMNAVNVVLKNTYSNLQCPEDAYHFKQPGGLSYGANIGYGPWHGRSTGMTASYRFGAKDHSAQAFDWNSNGKLDAEDKKVSRATGVFWHADPDGFQADLEDIVEGDGSGQTILFAESLNLPHMHLSGPAKDGLNPTALDAGIGVGLDALGLVPQAKPNLFVDRNAAANAQYTRYYKPATTRDSTASGWPRAGSLHSGIVNVVFADGHAGSISRDINWAVWASLHSPRGMEFDQAKLNESDF